MTDHNTIFNLSKETELPNELKEFLNKTQADLKGEKRRLFMARATALFGNGGHMRAERELGWDRGIIRKGTKELRSGISCIDNFSGRGRHPVEKHLPNLLQDIRDIVEPISQADPTFRTTNEYSPITAPEVRRRLINEKSYTDLPVRMILRTVFLEIFRSLHKGALFQLKFHRSDHMYQHVDFYFC